MPNHQRWKESDKEDIEKLLHTLSAQRGIKFKGFVGADWKCGYTLLKLECDRHGSWESTNLANFVSLGYGCSECKRSARDEKLRLADDEASLKFNKDGKFPDHIFVRDLSRQNKHQSYVYWDVYCSKCAEDEISQVGLSDGWFKSTTSHLRSGRLPCRCSKSYRVPERELLYLINKACVEKGFHIMKLHRNSKNKLVKSCKITYLCENGHEQTTSISKLLLEGRGCNSCRLNSSVSNGYYKDRVEDEDYLYLLAYPDFIKIGRSFEVKSRVRFHTLKIGEEPLTVYLFTGKHQDIYDIEQRLLQDRVQLLDYTSETVPSDKLEACLSELGINENIKGVKNASM